MNHTILMISSSRFLEITHNTNRTHIRIILSRWIDMTRWVAVSMVSHSLSFSFCLRCFFIQSILLPLHTMALNQPILLINFCDRQIRFNQFLIEIKKATTTAQTKPKQNKTELKSFLRKVLVEIKTSVNLIECWWHKIICKRIETIGFTKQMESFI